MRTRRTKIAEANLAASYRRVEELERVGNELAEAFPGDHEHRDNDSRLLAWFELTKPERR